MAILTLSDYRAISSGDHNMGEVRINGEGKLEKINNHVWRTSENTVVTTAQENIRVREELFRLISADSRLTDGEVLAAIREQLLGVNAVRALKRDEIAAYIGALDRGSAKGLSDRVIQLRTRTGHEKAGEIRLLTSEKASAAVLSANEQLGEARVRLQRACKTLMSYALGLEQGDGVGFPARLANEFCKAMGSLFKAYGKRFDTPEAVVQNAVTQAIADARERNPTAAQDVRLRKQASAISMALLPLARRCLAGAGFPASQHEEVLQHVRGNLTNFPLNVYQLTLAPSIVEELAPVFEGMLPRAFELLMGEEPDAFYLDVFKFTGRHVERPLGIDCKGVTIADRSKEFLRKFVVADSKMDDQGTAFYNDFLRGTVLAIGERGDQGPFDGNGGIEAARMEANKRLDRIKNFFVDPNDPEAQLNPVAEKKVATLRRLVQSLAQQKLFYFLYPAIQAYTLPFGNQILLANDGRQERFNLRQQEDGSFVLHCEQTGKVGTIAGSKGTGDDTLNLAPDACEQTEFGCRMDIRVDFDESGEPTFSIGEGSCDLKIPPNLTKGEDGLYHIDPNAPANEPPANEVPAVEEQAVNQQRTPVELYQGEAGRISELSSAFPISDADRTRFLAEAKEVKKIILDALPSLQGEEKGAAEAQLATIEARVKQVEDLRLSKPTSYRSVLRAVRQWCKAAEACYELKLWALRRVATSQDYEKLQPKESLKAELYLSLSDFDGVEDLDAECPNVGRYLKGIQTKLAKKLVKALGAHGVREDVGVMSERIGYCMGLVLNQGPWETISKDLQLTVSGQNVSAKSVLTPAKRIKGFADVEGCGYDEHVNGYNSASFDTQHGVNLLSSEYLVDGKKVFCGVRHGVNCAIGIESPFLRRRANLQRAREVAIAAVLTNPELVKKMPQGTDGVRTLFLTSTSLLTPDWFRALKTGSIENERQMLNEQIAAWRDLEGETLEFDVPDPDNPNGAPIKMKFKIDVAAFNFGVNQVGVGKLSGIAGVWDVSDPINRQGWTKLRQRATNNDLLSGLPEDRQDVIRVLREQIDDILRQQGERTDNHDAYKVVARINALSYLLDGVPAWNCKSGKDRTGELDVETKFLMTLIDRRLPIPAPGARLDDEQRKIFQTIALQGGNHEVQEYNTGIGGFKTKGVDSIAERLGGEQVYKEHAGGSGWVKT